MRQVISLLELGESLDFNINILAMESFAGLYLLQPIEMSGMTSLHTRDRHILLTSNI